MGSYLLFVLLCGPSRRESSTYTLNAVLYNLIYPSIELFCGMIVEWTAANLALAIPYVFLFRSLSFGVKANGFRFPQCHPSVPFHIPRIRRKLGIEQHLGEGCLGEASHDSMSLGLSSFWDIPNPVTPRVTMSNPKKD